MYKRLFLFVLSLWALGLPLGAKVTLPALFSDNMVLQRNATPEFRGEATPLKTVTITTSWDGARYATTASESGAWRLRIRTPEAGGPYTITISDGKKPVTLRNVLIGEVWFCSGQSNMELAIGDKVIGMEEALAEAERFPQIRLLHLQNGLCPRPSETVRVVDGKGWEVCSAESIRDFSAAGYYFGKELWQGLGVPIGLIEGSWGGTEIEGWISAEALSQVPEYQDIVQSLTTVPDDLSEQEALYWKRVEAWIAAADAAEQAHWTGRDLRAWARPGYDDGAWRYCRFPGWIQDQEPLEIVRNGIYYCRKEVLIPETWAGKDLTLYFSSVDDRDITCFNGVEVGRGTYYLDKRTYRIPGALVQGGKAVVGVRILDNAGKCSIGGENGKELYLEGPGGERIDLSGPWKYEMPAWQEAVGPVPYRTFIGPNIPTYLFNGIVHPVTGYPVKGVIWYQGEANLGRAAQYGDLMTLLIQDWRRAWGLPLDFYQCNLPGFIEDYSRPVKSRYAELREAQSRAARQLEGCGEAILIDVGDPYDTHPKDKASVGHRLALQALAKSYGRDVVCEGPHLAGYRIVGQEIRLSFTDLSGGLVTADGKAPRGFTLAGPDHVFHPAEARIEGDEIVVRCPAVAYPLAVRYAWEDYPDCNVCNGAGLPLGSCRTDSWPFASDFAENSWKDIPASRP